MSTSLARSRSDICLTAYQTSYGTGILAWRKCLLAAHYLPGTIQPAGETLDALAHPQADRLVALLESYFAGEPVRFEFEHLPLDMSGYSAFHLRLAAALSRVPYGRTVSYGGLAAAAGRPRAARAAGNFLAANPFPVILPCHRVIRSDGGLGGFSGGRGWKQRLLALEEATVGS